MKSLSIETQRELVEAMENYRRKDERVIERTKLMRRGALTERLVDIIDREARMPWPRAYSLAYAILDAGFQCPDLFPWAVGAQETNPDALAKARAEMGGDDNG